MATFRADQDATCDLLDADSVVDWGSESWSQLSQTVSAFESAWAQSPFPEMAQFVPLESDPQREAILAELIKVDQEMCWRVGQPRLLEEYLRQWPELSSNPKRVAGLLAAECLTRASLDVTPSPEELQSRFPDIAGLVALESINSQAASERRTPARRTAQESRYMSDEISPSMDGTQMVLAIGGRIGRFEIRGIVGRGGMGIVFRAYDPKLNREVALKTPLLGPAADHAVVKRFLREAQVVADIQHPHICPVFDCGEIDGIPYLVMPLVKGEPLGDWLKRRSPAPNQCAELLVKLAKALDRLHAAGILHQDIKPSNVVVNENDEPLLMDFGLAWKTEANTKSVTPDGFAGTPAYMSPEQVRGNAKAVDPRSDIYSLGVLMFEMLTGRPPFVGPLFEVLKNILQAEPPLPRSLRPELDVAIEAICLKAMAKHPDDRYQTANEFALALENQKPPETLLIARRRVGSRRSWLKLAAAVVIAVGTASFAVNNSWLSLPFADSDRDHRHSAHTAGAEANGAEGNLQWERQAPPVRGRDDHSNVLGVFATVLEVSGTQSSSINGNIEYADDEDWFQFRSKGGLVQIEVASLDESFRPLVRLHWDNRKLIRQVRGAESSHNTILGYEGTVDGRVYFVGISGADGLTGGYRIRVVQLPVPASQPIALKTDDFPDTQADAKPVFLNEDVTASFSGTIRSAFDNTDDSDWFKFVPKRDGRLQIVIATPNSSLDTHVSLYDSNGLVAQHDNRIDVNVVSGKELWFQLRAGDEEGATNIEPGKDHTGRYQVMISEIDDQQSPELGANTRMPVDSNPNGAGGAQEFEFDAARQAIAVGSIQPVGDEDWFAFVATQDGPLLIVAETPASSLDTHIQLFRGEDQVGEHSGSFVFRGTAGERYLVRMNANDPLTKHGLDPTGNYVLRLRQLKEGDQP